MDLLLLATKIFLAGRGEFVNLKVDGRDGEGVPETDEQRTGGTENKEDDVGLVTVVLEENGEEEKLRVAVAAEEVANKD